ncbi:MAG TPA: DUF2336 domain-containing protein [Alphaproteobacteria bacterium]|nr:DUF2336 domain-containing protein [Alphaproteobacteria bacterium]
MTDSLSQDKLLARLADTATSLAYDEAKRLLTIPDAGLRATLAARADAPPEVLYYLASDPSPIVRRAAAANPETPPQAELLLTRDADEEVRYALAIKVSRTAAERSADRRPGRSKLFFALLKALARDELARIRQMIAEAIKSVANIPREIIRILAMDKDPAVAAPVLQSSPVLREKDLLVTLRTQPASAVISAVARRGDVGPRLSDAVVATADEPGIAALLANDSAQIREETLDRLIEQSTNVASWQVALVERRQLSPRAATRLAHIVAGVLAEKLAARLDLDEKTLREIHMVVESRIGGPDGVAPRGTPPPPIAPPAPTAEAPIALAARSVIASAPPPVGAAEAAPSAAERARALLAAGKLDEDAVAAAVAVRDRPFVVAALALKARLPAALVSKIISLGGAKGVTALAWRAGFSMRLATQLQMRLAGIPRAKALYAKEGAGFPLSEEEMRWHLEFFGAE